jgi:hypothetical protein
MTYKVTRSNGTIESVKAAKYEIKFGALIFYNSEGNTVKIVAAGTWTDVDKEIEYL